MTSFNEFLESLHSDSLKRGKQFEIFVKWFLTTGPEWKTQVDEIWLWDEYPDKWGPDCGIDLVFKNQNGETWAVQAKCYSPEYQITKKDVDSFISESDRPEIHRRLLIATTDKIGSNAQRVLDSTRHRVVRYLLSDFEKAKIDYPPNIEFLSQGKRKEPPPPYPYQETAINEVLTGFKESDRGQLIMACGTGKSYITLWIKEGLSAQKTLVLVPSLSLLSQILDDWTFVALNPFDVLCVCSDQAVGKRDSDEMLHSISDVAFPVTSDTNEIKDFMLGNDDQVIFCTYQSSPLIAKVQKDTSVPAFDFIVADEAHRCAGKVGNEFATVLDGGLIRGKKRLFATATPRVYESSLKKRAEERGVEIACMDDEMVFGKPFHTLTFGEAIANDRLTDYQVVIVGVDDTMIAEWIENREFLRTDTDIETDARSLAAQIGLVKAVNDYDLRRVISFHSRISGAKLFSEDLLKTNSWMDADQRPGGSFNADYVSGKMRTDERKKKLKQLKNLKDGERKLLANARCLSEGIDVPSLDGIAFIDPRRSQIDIIQAVGRAIRLSSEKQKGTIIIPVFITDEDDPEQAIKESNFKPVWDVLNALKSHDDVLSAQLNQIRIQLGKIPKSSIDSNAFTKIIFDLPRHIDKSFASKLRTYLIENTTESWMFWYGLLLRYLEENGHCRIPFTHKTTGGYSLGRWVNTQRNNKDTLSHERRNRLETLDGWVWNILEYQWEEGFDHLKAYAELHGHCRVPAKHKTADGFKLGSWVVTQRSVMDTLLPARRERLDALPDWVWDIYAQQWEEGFAYLETYAMEHEDCSVPKRHKTTEGYALGNWVAKQRRDKQNLNPQQRTRLEKLPSWAWNEYELLWEEGFNHLKDYANERGHLRVSGKYTTPDGHKLGNWVNTQRNRKDTLSPQYRERLDALSEWIWDILEYQWEEGFDHLKAYADLYGHCKVPAKLKTLDGYKLGSWVRHQRYTRDNLEDEKRERLDALPEWIWDILEYQWEEGFDHLKAYADLYGHCRVSETHKTMDGYNLGLWVARQRARKDHLSPECRKRLKALHGWDWDSLREKKWGENFDHLKAYVDSYGHCKVPQSHKTTDGYNLGSWVGTQRANKDILSPERRKRLTELPGWAWSARKK